MKILKPVTSVSTISFKAGADLTKRLVVVQAAARELGLTFDVDTPLAKALARLIRQAEGELSLGQENPPAAPCGPLAAPQNPEEGEHA